VRRASSVVGSFQAKAANKGTAAFSAFRGKTEVVASGQNDATAPERESRSYSITSVAHARMYCAAVLGSFGWGLQQLISQFVVAGVALCRIF